LRWDHSENWLVPNEEQQFIESRGRYVKILLEDDDYEYMSGHVIDGRNLLPATSYLGLVWKTIGMIKGLMYTTIPIVFRDVKFIRATHLSKNDAVQLYVSIQRDGKFEITEGDSVVVTGTVYEALNPEQEMIPINILSENYDEDEDMTARDIYKELKLRGYQYRGLFRGLKSASISGTQGHIAWKNNWETFMDSMLQMQIIGYDTRELCVPTGIKKLVINPVLHASKLRDNINNAEVTTDMDKLLQVRIYKEIDTIKAGGVEIQGLMATQISRRKLAQDAVIEEHMFVAHCDRAKISLNEAIRISAQLVLEDHQIIKVQATELVEDVDDIELENLSSSLLLEAFGDMPLIQVNITLLTSSNRFRPEDLPQNFSIKDFERTSLDDKALIVAGFNLLTKQLASLERLLPFLRDGGYLLTREKCDSTDYKKHLQQYELNVILEKRTDKELVVLLKKKASIRERTVVYISNDNFNWLENLKHLVSDENKLNSNSRIIIVGEKNFECGLLGFVNCLRKEPGGELVRGVLVQDEKAPKFSLEDPFYLEQLQKDMTINVLRSNKSWGSYRHLKLPQPKIRSVPTAHVCQTVRGDLSTFCWIENNLSDVCCREDLVHVVYSSLNFKDIMLATGKLLLQEAILQGRLFQYLPLGMEYVGFDANGQRIMGIRNTDCIANVIEKDDDLCWNIPDAWTFEEAATVPCVYSTVYLALCRGVDIVLNSLAEEKLIASVRCLAQNGRFLEIGKFDLVSNNPLGMSAFQKGISFHGVRLENMMIKNRICKWKRLLFTLVKDGLYDGTIKPIQAKIFLKTDIEEAFRYMASGKHIGKIIINIHEKDEPLDKHIFACRRYYCLRDRSYIILGGLGGFGLELTDWLIFRGAKNIVLISRNGIKNGYQRMKIRLWKSYGVKVLIIKNIDVADLKDCEYLLRTAEKEAPVDAIFNLGVVLRDGVLKNQTAEAFAESFQSKARATQTLDKLSRKICLNLRHFVVFSSVSCGRGNAGQTNYGMANSIMERICEKRAEQGLPGLAIQWGAVGDVGLVADMQEIDKELIIGGTLQQKISCCLDELDKFLLQNRSIVSSMVVAEKKVGCHGLGSLVETVANILDISDMKTVSPNLSLAELGMDSMMTVEIKQTLEREFDVFLTAQEIRNLTFANLIKMSVANISDDNVHVEKKIGIEKSDVIKILVGIMVKNEDFVSQTDFSTNRQSTTTEVFLIPGIVGCGSVFNLIAPNIKFPTSSLNYSTNNIDCTNMITETTNRLTNVCNAISNFILDGKDFIIVGYSFGSLIAIEVTRMLEAMNFKGRVVLIDGAPELARTMFKPFEPDFDDANFQIDILTNIIEIYSAGSSQEILIELKKCETWDKRYKVFAKQFSAVNTSLSLVNLKTLCVTVYKHLSALRQYDPSTLPPIKSSIILLKCTHLSNMVAIEEDFCLHKSRKILKYATRNRKCLKCELGHKKEDHDCRMNFRGKAMEADAGVQLINHSNVLQEVYLINTYKQFKRKGIIAHLKKCFSYAVSQNKGQSDKFATQLKRIPDHVFDNHENCGDWCKPKEKYTVNLSDRTLYFFSKYAANAHKFSISASSQANENFNNIVANKAHKNKCLNRSVASDFRVTNSVCVKNDGESSTLNVQEKLQLPRGSHTVKYAFKADRKRSKRVVRDKSRTKKLRRIQLKNNRENLRKVTEEAESTTYKSNCGIDEATNNVNINKDSGETLNISNNIVYFDLETTGFSNDADILQIAAVYQISTCASKATGLCHVNSNLYLRGKEIETFTIVNALESFKQFLDSLSKTKKCLLVAHNASFDTPQLIRVIINENMLNDFGMIAGFSDTLMMLKKMLPERKGLDQFKLETVAKDFLESEDLGSFYDAIYDVTVLQKLIHTLNYENNLFDHSKTFYNCYIELQQKQKMNYNLQFVTELNGTLSKEILKRLALNAITYNCRNKNEGEKCVSDIFIKKVIKNKKLLPVLEFF
ncbi:Fatty acid synthase, partial [Trachymyrmex zeteki]